MPANDDDPLAPLPDDVTTLARGAANVGVEGLDDETAVVTVALRYFFAEHDDLRHAAVADRYDAGRVSTGLAAELAAVAPGGEIERLLRDHDVEPRTGPAGDADTRREEAETARDVFGDGDEERE